MKGNARGVRERKREGKWNREGSEGKNAGIRNWEGGETI